MANRGASMDWFVLPIIYAPLLLLATPLLLSWAIISRPGLLYKVGGLFVGLFSILFFITIPLAMFNSALSVLTGDLLLSKAIDQWLGFFTDPGAWALIGVQFCLGVVGYSAISSE